MDEEMKLRTDDIRQWPEINTIAEYLRNMEFKKKLFGCDRENVLDHFLEVTKKYEAIISALFQELKRPLQEPSDFAKTAEHTKSPNTESSSQETLRDGVGAANTASPTGFTAGDMERYDRDIEELLKAMELPAALRDTSRTLEEILKDAELILRG